MVIFLAVPIALQGPFHAYMLPKEILLGPSTKREPITLMNALGELRWLELNVSHHEDHVALGFVSQQHLYIGSKSPFSCFSREGIAWLNTRLGNGGEILALIRISHKIHSSLSLPKWNTDEFVETPELRNLYVEGKALRYPTKKFWLHN